MRNVYHEKCLSNSPKFEVEVPQIRLKISVNLSAASQQFTHRRCKLRQI